MVIAKYDDYVAHLLEAEIALKKMKQNLLENDSIKAYGCVLTTLTALRHVRDKIVTQSVPNSRMGLTRDLEPCTFGSRNVWWRGIVDLAILDRERNKAFIVDYKTGKSAQYADKDQLELMALAIFKHFPEITQVKAGLLFVVCNAFVKDKYDHEMQEDAWQKWTGQYDRLLEAYSTGVWNPKTSGLCRKHCPVLSCTHNGKNN